MFQIIAAIIASLPASAAVAAEIAEYDNKRHLGLSIGIAVLAAVLGIFEVISYIVSGEALTVMGYQLPEVLAILYPIFALIGSVIEYWIVAFVTKGAKAVGEWLS